MESRDGTGQPRLYFNCNIRTMDPVTPLAEAMLVQGERITALGRLRDIEGTLEGVATRVDLAGGTVIPGFNDCHCHILGFGLTLSQVDVSADSAHSIPDIQRAVAGRAEQSKPHEWIVGRGYDQNALAEHRHPTRQDLDKVVADHPVALYHTSGHALTCNSLALARAGVARGTPVPAGGEMERDAEGEPNGVLKETAMDAVTDAIGPATEDQGRDAILRAMHVMATQGITSATDANTGKGDRLQPELDMYRSALRSGKLSGRVTVMPNATSVAAPGGDGTLLAQDLQVGGEPHWLRIGPTKIFSDGALTTRTAYLKEPFADGLDNQGIPIWERDVLMDMIGRAHASGWQIATHAIGDAAIELVLDCYEAALAQRPRPDHRHRIEHCMLVDEGLAQRIQTLGVVAVVQPGFVSRLGDAYITGLGRRRASRLIPMNLFERLQIPVAFSSDRPVIPGAPLDGVVAAVRRRTPAGITLGPEHALSVENALRLYTAGSAYADRSEGDRGTLTPGKVADFAVLSADPVTMPIEDLESVRVVRTFVGGRETFREA